jgi:protein-L-isoaspartate(D-aspartate) O-methyltransferase
MRRPTGPRKNAFCGEETMSSPPADQINQQMVDRLIAEGALWSPFLVAAFRATPRHRFLDRVFHYQRRQERWREIITRDPGPAELRLLYSDRALITRLSDQPSNPTAVPISSSSQPSLMAQILEDLHLEEDCRVLEIGAGTGYNAALLAHVVHAGQVTSVDVDREVVAEAWDHLRVFPERRVNLVHADGRRGLPENAPYDRIVVTAATPDLEPAWLEQLANEGIVLAPLALAPGLAFIVRGTVHQGEFQGRLTRAAFFMPLRGEGDTGPIDSPPWIVTESWRRLPAPWACRKRSRGSWLGFIQSLAFFGLLHGLAVQYRVQENSQPAFGVGRGDVFCWLGTEEWQVTGEAGRDLGWSLWRKFLDAGGPWPTEFHLSASPEGRPEPVPEGAFVRQGPRCQQVWTIIRPRDRLSTW